MPRLIYTPSALGDFVRLAKFLGTKDKAVAKRAISFIRSEIEKAALMPARCRPVDELMHYREIIINFGSSGYVARFRYEEGGDIFIVRIKHQREEHFPSQAQ